MTKKKKAAPKKPAAKKHSAPAAKKKSGSSNPSAASTFQHALVELQRIEAGAVTQLVRDSVDQKVYTPEIAKKAAAMIAERGGSGQEWLIRDLNAIG